MWRSVRRAAPCSAAWRRFSPGVRERYRLRYLPAHRLYCADAAPEASADVVLDNTGPVRPRVLKWPASPFPMRDYGVP